MVFSMNWENSSTYSSALSAVEKSDKLDAIFSGNTALGIDVGAELEMGALWTGLLNPPTTSC